MRADSDISIMLRIRTLAIVSLIFSSALAPAFAQGRVTCYTTWDENYFYLAAQVDDSDVISSNTKPNSRPWEDDDVEVFLQVGGTSASDRNIRTFQMCVSAGGGSSWITGDGLQAAPKPIFTYKYATSVQGTLNSSEDVDIGYTVELAMPWSEMGIRPTAGMKLGFNVIVHCRGAAKDRIISLSPKVASDEEAQDPSKWSRIVLTGPAFSAVTTGLDRIISARYIARMPLIDGQIRQREWNQNTSFEISVPETPGELSARLPVRSLQKLAMTLYYYWYQADPRRQNALSHVRDSNGKSLLTDHPARGEGPWFSYDRVSWHKEELADIRECGIDVVLPVYRGDAESCASYAWKGLDSMISALRELQKEKKPFPLVGMCLDTRSILECFGGRKPDLREPNVQRALYGMIRDFFLRVPREFRATAHLLDRRAGRPAYIIYLTSSANFSGFDETFITYSSGRFREDFGAELCWIGGLDWKKTTSTGESRGVGFDGYCAYGAALGPRYDDSGIIRIGAVSPGFDNSAVPGAEVKIRPRMDGRTYASDWVVVTSKKPSWIIIDSWNDFEQGSEICRSSEYGLKYIDMTAIHIAQMRTQKEYDAKVLRHDAPALMTSGGISHFTLLIKNDGLKPWRAAEGYALGYSWFKDGRPYQEGMGPRPIQMDLLPGQSGEVTIGVVALGREPVPGQEKKTVPIPPGDYELFFEMIRLPDNKRFTELGDEPFIIPIRVEEAPRRAASILSVAAPTMIQGGSSYPVSVRARNDGSAGWSAGEVKLSARLFRVKSYIRDAEDLMEPVDLAFDPVPLPKGVPAGELVEVNAVLNARDTSGKPLPAWKPDSGWSYLLRWELTDSNGTVAAYDQIVDIFERDMGAVFIDCDLPSSIPAGKPIDLKVVVRNSGTETWTAQTHAIGAHWYYLDGTEALWDGGKTPIKEQMKPGEVQIVGVRITAPPDDGLYRLVLDMASGDQWGSLQSLAHGGDILQRLVSVTGGRLVFVDLGRLFDVRVASPDTSPADGDFDGQGHSLPEEVLPPLVPDAKADLLVCPSGCWWTSESGPGSQQRISFRYPTKGASQKNAVACSGQTVPVPPGRYKAVHILGAADGPDAKGAFLFSYPLLTGTVRVAVSDWTAEPRNGEKVGFVALHRHSASGDEPGVKCYLHHITLEADPTRDLSAIELPRNPSIKILAMTLEKAG